MVVTPMNLVIQGSLNGHRAYQENQVFHNLFCVLVCWLCFFVATQRDSSIMFFYFLIFHYLSLQDQGTKPPSNRSNELQINKINFNFLLAFLVRILRHDCALCSSSTVSHSTFLCSKIFINFTKKMEIDQQNYMNWFKGLIEMILFGF